MESGIPLNRLRHDGPIKSAHFLEDGNKILTGSVDGTVAYWEADSGTRLKRWKPCDELLSPMLVRPTREPSYSTDAILKATAWSSGSPFPVATCRNDGWICVENSDSERDDCMTINGNVVSIKFWDAHNLVHASDKCCIILTIGRDLEEDRIKATDLWNESIFAMDLSAEQSLAGLATTQAIRLFDLRSHKEVGVIPYSQPVLRCLSISQDARRIVTTTADSISFWDLRSLRQMGYPIPAKAGEISDIALSPDSSLLAVGCHDAIQIWDTELGLLKFSSGLHSEHGHSLPINSVEFSPDGEQLVSTSEDSSAIIWRVKPRIKGSQGLWCCIPQDEHKADSPPDLTRLIIQDGRYPIGSGGFADVYKGRWVDTSTHLCEPPTVVIKCIRSSAPNPESEAKLSRRLRREIATWQRLDHENIVPLLGISTDFGQLPAAISIFMDNGTVTDYLEANPDANRIEMVRAIALGLLYLHHQNPKIIHGDIKASNVLVDQQGRPRISDFGISKMLDDDTMWNTTSTAVHGSLRWLSPELLDGSQKTVTEASDVWAYGMTALEIITGKVPFRDQYPRNEALMIAIVVRGVRPERPTDIHPADLPNALWDVWQGCWRTDPFSRPGIQEVLAVTTEVARDYRPLRLLALDDSFPTAVSSLYVLREIMQSAGTSNILDLFDMIAVSGNSNVLAHMLVEWRLPIEEVILEFANYHSSIEANNEADTYTKLAAKFHRETILDRDTPKCKMIQICNNYRSGGAGITRNFESEGVPATILDFADILPSELSDDASPIPNPSEVLLVEAMKAFGPHRRVGCFISCGATPSDSQFETFLSEKDLHLSGEIIDRCRAALVSINLTHERMQKMVYKDAYFRFNPFDGQQLASFSTRGDTGWRSRLLPSIRNTLAYLKEEVQVTKVKACAALAARR